MNGCTGGTCASLPTDCTQQACPSLGYYCDLASKQCKSGCVSDTQCSGALNKCDPTTRTCGCQAGSCGNGSYCTAQQRCAVGCDSNAQCGGQLKTCSAHKCVECASSADCSGATPICNPTTNRCLGCLTHADCAAPAGATSVCTPANVCSSTCSPNFHACAASCQPNAAVNSCGTSCTPCPTIANGTATCDGTQCGLQCNAGFVFQGPTCVRVPAWSRTNLGNGPSAAGHTASASQTGVLVFYSASTWRWTGFWSSLSPAASPSYFKDTAMAYDLARNEVVLFGGRDGQMKTNQTWTWNGTTWTQRNPATSPSQRFGHAMAFDSARNRVVLFGGTTSFGATNDTWEWDGTTWKPIYPPTSPAARSAHVMAFDAVRGKVVLFGGRDGSPLTTGGFALSDTWEWDGTLWTRRTFATAPSGRGHAAMVFDSSRGRSVLFGGASDCSNPSKETWEYDGATWFRLPLNAASPEGRCGHAMAYDPIRDRVVVVGGANYLDSPIQDTWEY